MMNALTLVMNTSALMMNALPLCAAVWNTNTWAMSQGTDNAISCHQEPTTSSPTVSQPEHCSPNSSICDSDEEHPLSTEGNAPGLKCKAHLSQKKQHCLKCQALATKYTPPPLYNPSSLRDSHTALEIDTDAAQLDAALGAQTGKPGQTKHLGTILQCQQMSHLADLLAEGFYHIKWDGYYSIGLMNTHDDMNALGNNAGLGISAANGNHARRSFPVYNLGTTMGMGNSTPVSLNPKDMCSILNTLVGSEAVKHMARYQDCFTFLKTSHVIVSSLQLHSTLVERYGPSNTEISLIGPLGGRFDQTRSGQLILWELKLVIDFPHASTILIPSAVITHSNIPIHPNDF
ncbi:hypothetical protein GYMLUDRAFT_979975 [Collybiopsis luxurians FD-317 M1]|uniref:Uncharacterized protein n=1 Tax=Collybiopsis luxurians FD-317 M1 TaxID=944289 RepID=A0A0D0BQ99_9AGAR|nr:hypothetical protein GYMLUDRAFT_979975 [Collybiopsis luxurians FD-317 M1]